MEVSSVTFHYVLKALEMKTNISVDEMAKYVDLDIEDLEQNESVKSYKLSAIFRYCMEKTNNPNLAFDIGQSIPYQSLGILGYLLMNAKDLKEMIEKFSIYQKLVSRHLKFNFFEDKEYYKFAIYINENRFIPVPSFHAEVHLSAILNILTQILGKKVIPEYVYFSYSKQNELMKYEEIFGKKLYFEKDENAIFFKKTELNIPVNNANPGMLTYFEAQADSLLSQIENDSWFNKIEKEILKNIGDKDISINFIASYLNISARTLQNYLKSESKTFSEALGNVRKKLAKHYILNTKLDDATISFLLGYSEVSAFYRAYKKWNGTTPKELREKSKLFN
ncbi:MAG: AraC family transcriptional regulator [Arcobacteraceae bacterium]|nr:AraC family transcriptional regulator [Arcobacteraceae bacterium]